MTDMTENRVAATTHALFPCGRVHWTRLANAVFADSEANGRFEMKRVFRFLGEEYAKGAKLSEAVDLFPGAGLHDSWTKNFIWDRWTKDPA